MNAPTLLAAKDRILGGLWGSLVGDALGVPVEFMDRASVQINPVKSMRGFGTHDQPPGTWSDDGSLILCTAESLVEHEFDLDDLGAKFVRWANRGLWTAWGEAFDIGVTTSDALHRITNGTPAAEAGGQDEYNNGNGSLMRIIPAVLRFANDPIDQFADRLEQLSAITHGHARSQLACVFYGLVTRHLLLGLPALSALQAARLEFTARYEANSSFPHFQPVLEDDLVGLRDYQINSSGYVLHTLRASLWCLLNTGDYRDCVLQAVNLGYDTDTTGCVAGGLAGVAYGFPSIPADWLGEMARKDEVDALFAAFVARCEKSTTHA